MSTFNYYLYMIVNTLRFEMVKKLIIHWLKVNCACKLNVNSGHVFRRVILGSRSTLSIIIVM